MFQEQIQVLQDRLQQHADPAVKAWWENYVKDSAPFRGVKMAVIRSELHKWHTERIAGSLDADQQVDLALALFDEAFSEDKLAGTLFLQEILSPAGAIQWWRDVDRFAQLFAADKIGDWNVCDWFCVKVLGPLIQKEGEACARAISEWRGASNLWQAQAFPQIIFDVTKS